MRWYHQLVIVLAVIFLAQQFRIDDRREASQRQWMAEHAEVHNELNDELEQLRRQDGEAVQWLEDHERWMVQFSEGCIEHKWCEEWVDG